MKKLLSILTIMLLTCVYSYSQYRKIPHPDAIMLSYQPTDNGIGLKYEHSYPGVGVYGSVSYGNWGLYKRYNLDHHIKSSIGVLVPMRDYLGYKYDFTAGINYHYIHGNGDDLLNPKIYNPFSFELGVSVKLNKFAIAIRTDILRWEPCVDVGIPINYR